jgi:hypothetical protein
MTDNTITATGASGSNYRFYLYPWDANLKALGGVYMVLRKTSQNGNHTVLYIGQTSDLSERFDNHHKKSCFDRNRKTHIAAMLESSEAKRLRIEGDLISNYSPTCNGN